MTLGRPGPSMPRRSPSLSSDGTNSQTTSRYGTPEPMDVVPAGGGIIEHILTSKDFIVSYGGSSQYQSGGVSACGLAALNFVRVILGKEQDGIRGEALLREVASHQTAQVRSDITLLRLVLTLLIKGNHVHLWPMGRKCPPGSRRDIPRAIISAMPQILRHILRETKH